MLAIPRAIDGGNHTRSYADAAATSKAHYPCLDVSKATGFRVLIDDFFRYDSIRNEIIFDPLLSGMV